MTMGIVPARTIIRVQLAHVPDHYTAGGAARLHGLVSEKHDPCVAYPLVSSAGVDLFTSVSIHGPFVGPLAPLF